MIWVALAGPLANLLLAVVSTLILKGLSLLEATGVGSSVYFTQYAMPLRMMAGFSLYINILLGVFNLVPMPPLDGGRILTGILPERQSAIISRLEPFGFVLILFLVFFTDVWSLVLQPLIYSLVVLFAGHELGYVQHAMQYLFGH